MKHIEVYDIEAEDLEKLAEDFTNDDHGRVTTADIVEAMLTAIRREYINLEDYI